MHRLPCSLASALLLTVGLTTVGLTTVTAPAHADAVPLPLCTDDAPRPCLVSVTRDGAPLPDGYDLNARTYSYASGARVVALTALHLGRDDLGAGDLGSTWSVTVDLGDLPPRVVSGKAADISVERTDGSSVVTVTGRPVTVSGECRRAATPWRCPEYNPVQDHDNRDRAAIFRVEITDATDWAWRDAAQRDAAAGLTVFTNLAGIERPALIRDRATRSRFLRVPVGSHRFRQDGSTLVDGRLQVRLPWSLLESLYRIDDPASMTSRGLEVVGAGVRATSTVTNDPVSEAVLVDISRIRFRKGGEVRRVGIRRGVLTPTRPSITNIDRCCDHRFTVFYEMAASRGVTVGAHEIRCVPIVKGPEVSEIVEVDSFQPDRHKFSGLRLEPYDCRVRALSDAGPSRWSQVVRSP